MDTTTGTARLGDQSYRQYLKQTQFRQPAMVYVTLDEQADSINDGFFIVPMSPSSWGDIPASYHGGAGSFSFADGHAEIHQWRSATSLYPVTTVGFYQKPFDNVGLKQDYQWYKDRCGWLPWNR